MTFAFAFEYAKVRAFDFVNVMNCNTVVQNNLFAPHLLFTFNHVVCWKT